MTKNYQYHLKPQLEQYPFVKKLPNPVEFFCPRKYQGYHVRGQSLSFPYETPENIREGTHLRFYQMQLVTLVSEDARWRGGKENYRFGTIIGETKTEFEDFRTQVLLPRFKGEGPAEEEYPAPVSVENSLMEITATPYLEKCISDRQDTILVSFDMFPIYMTDLKRKEFWKPPTSCIHSFVASYWIDTGVLGSEGVRQWFSEMHDIFCLDLNYRGMSKGEFFDSLRTLGNLACGVFYGDFEKSGVHQLNQLLLTKDESGDPLKQFCFSFVTSMRKSLLSRKLIEQCPCCGDFMLSSSGKKYCSLRVEGKDCGKKVRNKAFYARHGQRIKEMKKEEREDSKRLQRNIKRLGELGLLKQPPKPQIQYTKKKVKKKKSVD